MPQLVAHNLTKEEFDRFRKENNSMPKSKEDKKEESKAEEDGPSPFDKFVENASDLFVEKPCISFCSCVGFIFLIVIIVVATGNMANSDESGYDWSITDDKYTTNYDMLVNLQDRSDLIVTEVETRTVPLSDLSMIVTYEFTHSSDIFTAANLQRMCTIESKWFGHDEYNDFCPVDE
jgi:hypothetical protein